MISFVFQGIKTLFAGSKCHDLVVTDAAGTIISGHFDKKIRIWDAFSDKCRIELPFNAAITSLSYNAGMKNMNSSREF
jgi:autophagy-related protein 16